MRGEKEEVRACLVLGKGAKGATLAFNASKYEIADAKEDEHTDHKNQELCGKG